MSFIFFYFARAHGLRISKAINLAKDGSQEHSIAIAGAIEEFPSHLRYNAVEVLLLNCCKEKWKLVGAEALVICISNLGEDLDDRGPNPSSKTAKQEGFSRRFALSNKRKLEKMIFPRVDVLLRTLEGYVRECFRDEHTRCSRDGKPCQWSRRVNCFARCLIVLNSNETLARALFKDLDALLIPIRFWFSTVLASEPGCVITKVHTALMECYKFGSATHEDFAALLLKERGGDEYEISTLFVSELRTMIKNLPSSSTFCGIGLVRLNLLLLCGSSSSESENLPPLRRAFLNAGAVSAITKGVLAIMRQVKSICAGSAPYEYLMQIKDILSDRDGVRWAKEALAAGLLEILTKSKILTACDCITSCILEDIGSILHPTLTQYLVYHSVAQVAEKAMDMSSDVIGDLGSSPYSDSWTKFRSTLVERSLFMYKLGRKTPSPDRMLHCEYVGPFSHLFFH